MNHAGGKGETQARVKERMSKWCKTAPLGVNTKLMDGGSAEREKRGRKGGGLERKTTEIVFDRSEVGWARWEN